RRCARQSRRARTPSRSSSRNGASYTPSKRRLLPRLSLATEEHNDARETNPDAVGDFAEDYEVTCSSKPCRPWAMRGPAPKSSRASGARLFGLRAGGAPGRRGVSELKERTCHPHKKSRPLLRSAAARRAWMDRSK